MDVNRHLKNIVLIDDDEDECFVFTMILKELDPSIKIVTQTDPDLFISTIDKHLPDLIFLDINMPKINGFDCIRLLKSNARHKDIPVVMYSSSSYSKDISLSYGLGATLYFGKGTNFELLKEHFRQILNLQWTTPQLITPNFYKDGVYLPFAIEGEIE